MAGFEKSHLLYASERLYQRCRHLPVAVFLNVLEKDDDYEKLLSAICQPTILCTPRSII